ncbi:hypothetical protein [Pseudomonas sp. SJZ131]|uniref:hypothetical protein n=1 Tax=Pseudomonas sp. SJZ131 TaxID=2572895 RepID=UPI00119BD885|nr:hypothetical protein [Pseudomonas sp. SJZ131]TWD44613.1 hypothetical protein FBY12_4904 [Pseudomonas sp. SJZ131]
MWILNSGRKHFLEFLRNTSIQFFLMVLVWIAGGKFKILILKQNYKDAIPMGAICFVMFLLLYLAAHANIKTFFKEFRDGAADGLDPFLKTLDGENQKRKNRLKCIYLIKNCKSALAEAFLLIMGIYFVMIFGLFYSVENAQRFMTDISGGTDHTAHVNQATSMAPKEESIVKASAVPSS